MAAFGATIGQFFYVNSWSPMRSDYIIIISDVRRIVSEDFRKSGPFLRIVSIPKIFTDQSIEYFELNEMFPHIAEFYNYNFVIVTAGVHQGLDDELAPIALTF